MYKFVFNPLTGQFDIVTIVNYGTASDIPFMNSTADGFDYLDGFFEYNKARTYLDLHTNNGSNDGALKMTANQGNAIWSSVLDGVGVGATYILSESDFITTGYNYPIGSFGTDGINFFIKHDVTKFDWGVPLLETGTYIKNTYNPNNYKFDMQTGSFDVIDLNTGISQIHIVPGYQAYGDYLNTGSGAYFDFNLGTNLYTFWGTPTNRALQIDLAGFSMVAGDPDALVGGSMMIVDPGGILTGVDGLSYAVGLGGGVYDVYGSLTQSGLTLYKAGEGIKIKEGSNATMGLATLVAGVAVVSTTKVTANSRIFLTRQTVSGTLGTSVNVTARTAGTSFTITAQGSILDTSTVAWMIVEPA